MDESRTFLILADAVLLLHALFVAFVLLGLVLVIVGRLLVWDWVRNPWFRATHLAAIGLVVLQSWLGALCPLTTLEMSLRSRAQDAVYPGSFIAHWLEVMLYYQAPAWVFATCYTAFGAAVLASWFWVKPRPFTF
ncbi:MAG: DUF2784 domain-containing protein [Halieaceae bacterium]